ncbi:alpha/beta hydrolase [Pseudomonas citronellolis]|uniref:alpha/beta hydrolase n=1 Tax=Pseudomonas citronellolis TaxID=53408 RepID=UPI000E2FDCC7|nr:alpha/beta hydrolase [Pseudomonas citronellolis]MCP1603569.1 acetyl esterase/lipase [Pseudomonas citronellolis]MCP1653364.1 acetyl esterase/lipase [Pseudomonas citronellolis]MCP1720316.1 acetyl esterase/lipase [Pseudomonas citronellolis]
MNTPMHANTFTRVIHPPQGRFAVGLLSLLLRLTVKSKLGPHIDIAKLRQKFGQLNRQASPALLASVKRENVDCNGTSAQWLSPEGYRPDRVLLYIHGGAFVAYTPDVYAAMVASWCRGLKTRALMVDYGLAPEHPYPTALDQCLAAYQWLLDQGFKARDIVIAGDSAGGNLVMATLQHLKAGKQPLPSCAVLLSPFLDLTLSGKSGLVNAPHDPIFTLPFAVAIRDFYAPAHTYSQPSVSPLFGDFAGLPPMLFQVGSTEMLLDDSVRAAAKADAAGVPVQLEIWKRLPHVFQLIPALPQTRIAAQRIQNFINEHTAWDG